MGRCLCWLTRQGEGGSRLRSRHTPTQPPFLSGASQVGCRSLKDFPGAATPAPRSPACWHRALRTSLPALLIAFKPCTAQPGAAGEQTLISAPGQPGWQLPQDSRAAPRWKSHVLGLLWLKHPCGTPEAPVRLETLAGCAVSGPQGQPARLLSDRMTQGLAIKTNSTRLRAISLLTSGNSSPLRPRQAGSGSEEELRARAARRLLANAHPGLPGPHGRRRSGGRPPARVPGRPAEALRRSQGPAARLGCRSPQRRRGARLARDWRAGGWAEAEEGAQRTGPGRRREPRAPARVLRAPGSEAAPGARGPRAPPRGGVAAPRSRSRRTHVWPQLPMATGRWYTSRQIGQLYCASRPLSPPAGPPGGCRC